MNEVMESTLLSVFTFAAMFLILYLAASVAVVALKVPKPYRPHVSALIMVGLACGGVLTGWWPFT